MRRVALVAAMAVLIGVLVSVVRTDNNEPTLPAIQLNRNVKASFTEPLAKSPLFVLVIGSDVREGSPRGGRADSLHVVAINPRTGHGSIVGIPRDSYVPIPGRGTNKINASLYFGGPELVVQTVSQFTGINFHYWALVEFSRFRDLVDRLGGIEVNIPYPMSDSASGAHFGAGLRKLTGAEALAFSRARKSVPGGDFGRSENQGRVLLAALRKFQKDASSPIALAKYFTTFGSLVETNVPTADLIRLAQAGRRIDPDRIQNVVIPAGTGSAGGASVVFVGQPAQDVFNRIKDDAIL